MEKRKCLAFLFCVILCYPLFQIIASAQSSLQVSIISQGSITYSPNTNLAVIPDDWGLTYGTGPQIIFLDTSVEHTAGNPSMRLAPHTSADMDTCREIDGTWYNVKPGDHIIVKVWVKTGPSGLNPDPSSTPGGRIGMDSYAHTSAGYGTPCTGTTKDTALGLPGWYGDQPASWNDGSIGATPNWWVSWGKD